MKMTLALIRGLGILGAAWIVYMAMHAYFTVELRMGAIVLEDSPVLQEAKSRIFWDSVVPFSVLALFIVLPYRRLPAVFGYFGVGFIFLLSLYFFNFFYAQYFLASRFVASAIPPLDVWISAGVFLVFFLSQIIAIVLQKAKSEQG